MCFLRYSKFQLLEEIQGPGFASGSLLSAPLAMFKVCLNYICFITLIYSSNTSHSGVLVCDGHIFYVAKMVVYRQPRHYRTASYIIC